MRIAERLRRKGELKVRDLARCIGRYAFTCAHAEGITLSEQAGFEDLDDIINDLDHCLYSIRVLERDVFEASNKQAYDKLRKTLPEGGVVTALRSLRDAATHHDAVIEPNLVRAVATFGASHFIVFERWRPRNELPSDTFDNLEGKYLQERADAYAEHVAGRYVLDTLFDAFHFFDLADPKLVKRDPDQQIRGFPIPPLDVPDGYYRMHPDWPTHDVADRARRDHAGTELPAGDQRLIEGALGHGRTLVGWTERDGNRSAFTEPVEQVVADVRRGYAYLVTVDGRPCPVQLEGGGLVAGGVALADVLTDLHQGTDDRWAAWAELAADDALYYQRQRRW